MKDTYQTITDGTVNVHDGQQVIGWAFLSDGHGEPAGTPMAAKFAADGCDYTQHESIDAAIAHIRS